MEDHHGMRAWDIVDKCYYIVDPFYGWHKSEYIGDFEQYFMPKEGEIDQMILEQCTGLKENEKFYYENDKVKFHNELVGEETPDGFIGFVKMLEGQFYVVNKEDTEAWPLFVEGSFWEIIGTIHDKEEDERTN